MGRQLTNESRIDNGVNIASGTPAYAQRSDLSSRVKRLNPNWNEPADDSVFDVSPLGPRTRCA